ncbi:AAA family ATPase [Streptomyces griseus]|uniref:AAA family ATPase n=1 Tax=Streptomyces griseus TaxID=1911 RepID=UPI00368BF89D
MKFVVLSSRRFPTDGGPRECILVPDSWNDYGFTTLYDLWFRQAGGVAKPLGQVKIAHAALGALERPVEAGEFEALDDLGADRDWYSLGQDDTYYENIRLLGDGERLEILRGLNDLALNPGIMQSVLSNDVTDQSLLRTVEIRTVENQFRRIAQGGPRLTDYAFAYYPPSDEAADDPWDDAEPEKFDFRVTPHSAPPTNVHVLIGRNGVGKTTALGNIVKAVVRPGTYDESAGTVVFDGDEILNPFVNVVSVSFSAFDPIPHVQEMDTGVTHTYVGLATPDESDAMLTRLKTHRELGEEFSASVEEIKAGSRTLRWITALERLSSDPYFAASPIHAFANALLEKRNFVDADHREAQGIFQRLSSGHKIVLLTVTRLVETVAERSLVLLDEPEAHLHPPLLAAFIRALSELLTDRNAVAIIATHSPVVLQEVPKSCVLKITRRGPERPLLETFGENVGILTHEVFGLEVSQSGYRAEIRAALKDCDSYEDVLEHFAQQLGSEAKTLTRILLAHRSRRGQL